MEEKNKYELYKNVQSKESYFNSWETAKLKTLTEEIMDNVYEKYLVKCAVLQRDNFACQNINCEHGDNLTIHHYKHKRNGGEDKPRNLVTLCRPCHKKLNSGEPVTYNDTDNLPAHIRGQTQIIDRPVMINWKVVRAEMKGFRKKLKYEGLIADNITWELLCDLFKWLLAPYDDEEDEGFNEV